MRFCQRSEKLTKKEKADSMTSGAQQQTEETACFSETTNAVIPSSQIIEVKNGLVKLRLTESLKGKSYKHPVEAWIPLKLNRGEQALYRTVWEALSPKSPSLIPIAFENATLMKMAKYLSRNRSGSKETIAQYLYMDIRYAKWLQKKPDELIQKCIDKDGIPNQKQLQIEIQHLDDYVGDLKARNLAPKTVSDQVKSIKCLFMVHGLTLTLPYHLSSRRNTKDRAPTPEELQRIIDLSELRDKFIVSALALGGFREGTLAKLCYRHVKHDLEKGIIPVHVHIEAEITKGQYGDYDTFIGAEAVTLLKAYLEMRRQGSPCGKIPPETITNESPLIRDERAKTPTPIEGKQIYRIIHNLYRQAGLLDNFRGRRYSLCAHSIRKFFRTQMTALGVPVEYTEYMMGHLLSTYNDIQMKGTEFLRNIYAASGLSIRQKTQVNKIDTLKEIIRAWGLNPEEILTRDALAQPHRTVIMPNVEETQTKILSNTLRDMLRDEIRSINNTEGKE